MRPCVCCSAPMLCRWHSSGTELAASDENWREVKPERLRPAVFMTTWPHRRGSSARPGALGRGRGTRGGASVRRSCGAPRRQGLGVLRRDRFDLIYRRCRPGALTGSPSRSRASGGGRCGRGIPLDERTSKPAGPLPLSELETRRDMMHIPRALPQSAAAPSPQPTRAWLVGLHPQPASSAVPVPLSGRRSSPPKPPDPRRGIALPAQHRVRADAQDACLASEVGTVRS